MAATGAPNVAQNLFVGGYGSPVQGIPGSKVMSSWLPITLVGSAAATGVKTSPGPTITYTSTGGNTLVLAGYVQGTASLGLSAVAGVTSVTDTAGNAWQWSPGNSQFPPSAYNAEGNGYVAFVAWCVNAAAVTSVTVQDSTGFNDTWNVSLSEWAGITWADYGVAGTAPVGGTSAPMLTVPCSTPLDLVVAVLDPLSGNVTGDPGASFTQLPGTALNNTHKVIGYQILSTLAAPGFVFLGGNNNQFTGGPGPFSLAPPADLVPGDLIIYDMLTTGGGTVTGWPPGFTQQLQITGVNNAAGLHYVATKLADGTEGNTLTVSVGGSGAGCGLVYGLRGAASATPANVATFTQSGYQTSAPPAALTISGTTDATVYGYAGATSGFTGSPGTSPAGLGTLLNSTGAFSIGNGGAIGIGWGTNVAAPGTITGISPAIDLMDWAMDFPLRPLGIGGQVTYAWTQSGATSNALAAMSFGPAGTPAAVQPGGQAF